MLSFATLNFAINRGGQSLGKHLIVPFMLLFLPSICAAQSSERVLPPPCVVASHTPLSAVESFKYFTHFDCSAQAINRNDHITYGLFKGLHIAARRGTETMEFRHSTYQLADEKLWVHYTDGKILTSSTRMMAARRLYSAGLTVLKLPPRAGVIDAILLRVDDFAGERGVGENAFVISAADGATQDLKFMVTFALLAGALASLFIYNVSLYAVLRYPFIFAHCVSTLSVMMFVISWSGAIFYFVPDMTPNTQVGIIFVSAGFFMLSLAIFMLTFIERESLARYSSKLPITFAVLCIVTALSGWIVFGYVPNSFGQIFYISLLATLCSILICAIGAWRKGSRSAAYYLFVWSVPIVVAIARILWAFGMFHANSVIAESSPSFIMAIETLMSAFAVSWRIGQLRNERDEARTNQLAFKHLAETDSLTGLLNRRAFLEQTRRGTMLKQFVLIDIDKFKAINDTFGHEVGDQVIVAVATVIRDLAPQHYIVGRMGGEEFGVLIDDLAPFFAQRLCDAIREIDILPGVLITASAGVAFGPINSAEQWHDIYTSADRALYEAKRSGRDRVCQSPSLAAA